MSDFEDNLREKLTTLAREGVLDSRAGRDPDLADVQWIDAKRRRPIRVTRVLQIAAVIVLVVAIAGVVIARRDTGSTNVQNQPPMWTILPAAPIGARYDATSVFTGRDVVIWGGRFDATGGVAPAIKPGAAGSNNAWDDGAVYDTVTNRWTKMAPAPIPSRYGAVGVWTGSEVLIVGGQRQGSGPGGSLDFRTDGAAYNPATNSWRTLPDAPGCPSFGAWTGSQLVAGGTCQNTTHTSTVEAYNPSTNVWVSVPRPPVEPTELVTTGSTVVAWSAADEIAAVYSPASRTWHALTSVPNRSSRDGQPVSSLLVSDSAGRLFNVRRLSNPTNHGVTQIFSYDAASDTWGPSTVIRAEGPTSYEVDEPGVAMRLAGDGLLAWQALGGGYSWYDPATAANAWINRTPLPPTTTGVFVAIGPRRFFVWGGQRNGGAAPTNVGAILTIADEALPTTASSTLPTTVPTTTPPTTPTTVPTATPNLEPADAQTPVAGGCGGAVNGVASVTMGTPDNVAEPRCLIVLDSERLRVVNGSSGPLTFTLGHHFRSTLLPRGSLTLNVALGKYLASGVHYLIAGPEHAEIWVNPNCAAAGCP
jgi:hypothetical protein